MTETYVVQRLKAIKPGQCLRYYRGNFDEDIARSAQEYRGLASPQYTNVLKSLRDAAESLAESGRITITTAKVAVSVQWSPKPIMMTDYIAVGK